MFYDEVTAAANAAKGKYNLLHTNPFGYFLAAVLAGAFIGFGVLLAFTVGGLTAETPFCKLLMGCVFGVALSLVVMAGGELFTGNNMVMAMGAARKTVTLGQCWRVWGMSYLGNLVGAVLLSLLFVGCGLATGAAGSFMVSSAETKMALSPLNLVCRGALCNTLVCLAVWCGFRCKSESGKLIMIFWCLLAFITTGFEHSIANMTLLTISLLAPTTDAAVSLGGEVYNLFFVTLGNMIGGIAFVALPYLRISGKKS
ncbi:MAG: formate/nitrite transporter family protein [Oscillospiraceae bacterium]|nr:formate/nitrite transporter family protein [Oscillospiraceae bacterium]